MISLHRLRVSKSVFVFSLCRCSLQCFKLFLCLVDTRGAGSGSLTLSIKAAGSEVKHTVHDLDTSGVYQVVFHPQLPIPHRVQIKYNNMYISGSETSLSSATCLRNLKQR